MSFLLFQTCVVVYLLATAAYLVFFLTQKNSLRQTGRAIFLIAFGLHSANLVARAIETGHTPITSHHETISFFAWSLGCCYLSFRWRYAVKNLGAFVSLLVLALMLIAAFSSRSMLPLPPALQSLWLPVHASITLFADGFLALSCIGSIMYLLQEREIKKKRFGLFYSRLPSLETLDKLNHHCLSMGFPLFTLGLITGSLWAKQAWGAYWQWDPKETWSLITWFLYAAAVHQRFTVGWRGRRVAILSIVAFLSVLFTLWGVSFLLEGVHTYVS
ncbi:MAG: c-type cytochrome biogenesis protein CcsB [Desulfobulbus sp.]|jgi:cytochrome c-type biogenesis protein CcsB|uniref:c-type cytochrome biogenesis protein CcsB n=1 Tax=Desulfobulbus sp. TaxID=895 RepID=UPI00285199BB|nr:c-type cytochrome biogenesis protein CcsB [Desulfobulbus sp.]MDR2550589.1 c-type cytochrome biogenesis protein CcsB [Desulfobulbus sp.]